MFNFLGLPAELRLMIYRFSLVADRPLRLCLPAQNASLETLGINTAILQINRQTYFEAVDVLYASNKVVMTDFFGKEHNICVQYQNTLSRKDRCSARSLRKHLYPRLLDRMSTVYLRIYYHDVCWNPFWWQAFKMKALTARIRSVHKLLMAMAPDKKKILVLEFPYVIALHPPTGSRGN